MIDYVLLIGILTAIFVGINIGGSSTAVAWGPAVGAGVIRKTTAAMVMTFFVFLAVLLRFNHQSVNPFTIASATCCAFSRPSPSDSAICVAIS